MLFEVSDAVKYLTDAHGPIFGLLSRWTPTAVISFVVSFYASAGSLQIGHPIEVIATTSVAANLSAILRAILVFGEPIGKAQEGSLPGCSRLASSSPARRPARAEQPFGTAGARRQLHQPVRQRLTTPSESGG